MQEAVRWIQRTDLPRASRWPSLAGNGLPERMRTTAFAFLGLTAAVGLSLVAIFAQLGFHVLSPEPLPEEPAAESIVSEAVALRGAPRRSAGVTEHPQAPLSVGGPRGGESEGSAPAAAPVASTPSSGGVTPEATGNSVPKPPATPAPAASPTPGQTPAPTGDPASTPAPKPPPTPARPATPTPTAPQAPGNSSSSAAAEHASDRGVEASSKQTAAVQPPPATGSTAPPADEGPGNGNGKALGHSK
jgi:outer membrane biosynthesis protein TonB